MEQVCEMEGVTTASTDSSFVTDTIVVGAGPSGLAMAACLARKRVPYLVLERASAPGWSWRNHYERLHLHTVRDHSSLPFLPFGKDVPKYVPRDQVVVYLDRYARHFAIDTRYNENVASVRRRDARWETITDGGRYQSARVVIASGYNRKPVVPSWPGQETFAGELIHSASYRNAAPYRGKRVLVVGFGNTGAEIALDLVEHDAKVALSVRGPVHVVPREFLGTPTQVTGMLLERLPAAVAALLSNAFTRLAVGDLSRYGLHRPVISPFQQVNAFGRVPVIDVGTLDKIKAGVIRVAPNIARFEGQRVHFADATDLEFDAVILATGYRPGLDDFLEHADQLVDARGYPLELSTESTRFPGLYFLGFKNPPSGFLRQIALDAQSIARDIAHKRAANETTAHA